MPKKKTNKKKTAKKKVKEVFEVENKEGKEKEVIAKGEQEVPIKSKDQIKRQNKILKSTIIILAALIILIVAAYFGIQNARNDRYKTIDFEAVNYGNLEAPLIMYETKDLLISNDGTDSLFGFRIRTKPSKLEKIPFENLENFELMKVNGYTFGNSSLTCEGKAVIAMENLKRTFSKMGMSFVYDTNSSCDPEGRYNYFQFTLGDETAIKEISPRCYEISIKGNESSCEILPATEKLMAEMYIKYDEIY